MTSIYDMYAYSAAGTKSSSETTSTTSSTDTSDSFMTLLLAELKYQNPLEPMDTSQMVSQMVELNSLTELQKINDTMEQTNYSNQFQSGTAIIGKEVEYSDEDGNIYNGLVTSFEMVNNEVMLTIDDDSVVALSSINRVSQQSETTNG